jgi:hypothetical protein
VIDTDLTAKRYVKAVVFIEVDRVEYSRFDFEEMEMQANQEDILMWLSDG